MRKKIIFLLASILVLPSSVFAKSVEDQSKAEIVTKITPSYSLTQPADGSAYYEGETFPNFSAMADDTLSECTAPKNSSYSCGHVSRAYLDTNLYGWNTYDDIVLSNTTNTQSAFSKDKVQISGYVKGNWSGGSLITPTQIQINPVTLIKGNGLTCGVGFPFGVSCSASSGSVTLSFPTESWQNINAATYNISSFTVESPTIVDSISNVTQQGLMSWKFGTQAYSQVAIASTKISS
ncbi:hypothetical protein [Paenibacillus sp. GYB003]|uniref:hypothetical protein n=1 Tax=Paenibacillus sp. GYB003 TaxID=2994392 RepID=UPI002F96B322